MLYKIVLCILVALILILGFRKVLADDGGMMPLLPEPPRIILTIKQKVQMEFGSTSPMIATINCESGFRQFDEKGETLKSLTSDVGVMQINQVHWEEAEALGLDIFNSVDDNIKMGRIVYNKQGITAWTCFKG